MSAVVINGGLVHYEAFGRGTPPILFVHGWLGSWRYWMPVMETLAIEHRVYALDLWGFGDSDKTRTRFSVEEYVLQLRGFIAELGIINPVLVGHALGAGVVIQYAAIANADIEKIVAVSLPIGSEAIDNRLRTYFNTSVLSRIFRWKPIPNQEIEEEAARAHHDAITTSLHFFETADTIELLRQVNCDVLVVYGERDDVVAPQPIQALNHSLNHVRHIGLSESRHFPMVDESSKFTRLLREFSSRDASLHSLSLKDEWRRRIR